MKNLSLALLSLFTLSANAAVVNDPTILACKGEGDGWTSELALSDSGRASLTVQKKGVPASVCEMKIKEFNYSENTQIPEVLFEFDRKSCTPKLDQRLDHELLSSIALTIDLERAPKQKSHPGVLHWLRYSQSNECVLKTYNSSSIKLASDRWKKGLWPN